MADQVQKGLIIDPHQHAGGVHHFLKFFNIESEHPDINFLHDILSAFTHFPYENISKIIQLNHHFLSTDHLRLPEKIMDDYEKFRLGGTCFSLTFFLQSILSINGFLCYPVMADMKHRTNVHCALIVLLLNKKYLVDPGYILNQPMEVHPDKPRWYRTPHTGVELYFDKDTELYHLYTFNKNEKKWRYRFRVKPTPLEEFLQHWQDSFYWPGMHGICLTQMRQDGLVYIQNDFLQISDMNGKQKMRLKQNLHATIKDLFGIAPELVEQALAAIPENMAMEPKRQFINNHNRETEHETV
jgi:N-hydroxyarylamine O-acetyltransferase